MVVLPASLCVRVDLRILFAALSYGKLVRRYPSAGSAYTYAQKSISPTVGFMVGWSSLLDYLFAPMINISTGENSILCSVPSIPSWDVCGGAGGLYDRL